MLCIVAPAVAQDPTYHGDIKPILDRHCITCHQTGDVGAMPLTTYEEVAAYGNMIQYVTSTKLMPPWYADPSYSHFSNERVLTTEEIQKIDTWVNTGMKEGALPYGREISATVAVTVLPRKPDLVLSMKEAFEQYGIYMDQYQVFVIPTQLDQDKWIEGIEFVPGNKKIVRYASISVSDEHRYDSLDKWDPRYGYYSFGGLGINANQPYWYTWSPQQKMSFFPKGSAKFLPKDSELLLHIHYGPTGKPLTDSSVIRLYFTDEKIEKPIYTAPLINPHTLTNDSFFIEANTTNVFHGQIVLQQDLRMRSITPQANLLCRSWEIFAKIPGNHEPLKLLKIKDWNFNWKQTFHFAEPVLLPEGSVIHALAHYDNTLDNPCNPADNPVPFKLGPYLFNELFFVHFEYTSERISLIPIGAPTVIDENVMSLYLEVNEAGMHQLEFSSIDECEEMIVENINLKKGLQTIQVSVENIQDGNYKAELINAQQHVVGRHLFTKMKSQGM